ncbi:unnamed protein product [Adineta ricciae]|uniref:LisH domain-containing protein ARMC9 n=1 Tax=Adineta ricciae TaxID=249248 RepID=A0A813QZ92_ADIRI|nr:unnamed protein product [Adineta ricciae]CAF1154063.1 unnamed protein product [Adineta ricciae]
MSQSIDFRINDFVIEYLDYKGFNETVGIFLKERKSRQEPIYDISNGKPTQDKDQEKYQTIKNDMLKYLDDGNRADFFRLWSAHIPSNVIASDPSLKSLEFLIYAHFAIYYLRPNALIKNDVAAKENMQVLKTYMETIKGQAISQTSDILPLFALPFVASPDKHASFQELFSNEWPIQLRKKASNFFDWIFSNRPLPRLVELLQNGERASHVLTQLNTENEELKDRNRETNKQIKNLSTDYCNLISITMELVETLQQAIVGKTITNDYIDNVCTRLGLARLRESLPNVMESARLGIDDPFTEKFDYTKIKRDVIHVSTPARQKALLLQALRWKLTKARTDFKREKMLESYIACDLLGCNTDTEQQSKIIKELTAPSTGETEFVKEEWARLINTIASLRKGRNYLVSNESLIICMQKSAILESSDTSTRQHLLAALQKLSLRRSVQTIMINQNMIKWLVPLLSKTDDLSDYTLEYGVALLMNLCLRTNGRKKCAEIAEQVITVLSNLLSHPNHETRPYVNSSLYSVLTVKLIRDKANELNLDNRLRALIRTETYNSETKGQLEFLLNLLCKNGDQVLEQTSDNEQDNDEEDEDVMEADLDLADKLQTIDQELSGDDLMLVKYSSQTNIPPAPHTQKSYNNNLYASSVYDFKSKSVVDSVLHRPTTPGQLRQSIVAHTVDSLANSLVVGDFFHNQNNGSEPINDHRTMLVASASVSKKKPLSASVASVKTNNSIKFSNTLSSISRPKSTNRTSSADQSKQLTPVLAFSTNDELDRAVPSATTQKVTPPMKFSFSEPPRSNSSASIRSSASSILELSNGNANSHKTKRQ